MARGLPDSIYGSGAPLPAAPVRPPSNDLSRGLDQITGGGGFAPPSPLGAGPGGTVLPPPVRFPGAGATPPPADAPYASVPSSMEVPAPISSGPQFKLIDLVAQVIVTTTGEVLPYPDDLQRHFIKWCLKISLLHRNEVLQQVARGYGTSLEEIAHELEEALLAAKNMQAVQEATPPHEVQENETRQ